MDNGHHQSGKAAAGFTLVELLLVMALLAIVIAVSAPQLSRFFRGRSLESEARRMLSVIRYAQERAASEGMPMLMWVDDVTGTYGVEAETTFDTEDLQQIEYQMGRDLEVEVVLDVEMPWDSLTPRQPLPVLRNTAIPQAPQSGSLARSVQQNLPRFRFLPDGGVDEENPEAIELRDSEGNTLQVRLTRNRLSYEIGNPYDASDLQAWTR